jgi:uncharacterized protein YbcC (UPF0753/DUF2309 family)
MTSPVASPSRHESSLVEQAIETACRRVPPLWPLKHFVAVNPFLGLSSQTFRSTCASMHRIARVEMLMPRAFYREAIANGQITEVDLQRACDETPPDWNAPKTVAELLAGLQRDPSKKLQHAAHVPSVAEILDQLADGDRTISGTGFMIDEISKWCAAYFDEGQSIWRLPGRGMRPYAAWRAVTAFDRNAEVMGVRNFRALVRALPDDPVNAIAEVVRLQSVPDVALADYLHQALVDIGGWAAYARYLQWNSELFGGHDTTIVDLLAIRVVWGYTLFAQRQDAAFANAWRTAMAVAAQPHQDERLGDDPDLALDIALQGAYERAYQRRLLQLINDSPRVTNDVAARPLVQAAFCIDVRSEVYRRALEAELANVQTIGFAGFFGLPIEYIPIGQLKGGAQCPVLLTPSFTVCESVRGASEEENAEILGLRLLRRRVAKAWKSFKTAAVSSFIFVETAGLWFAGKIIGDTLALTRTVHDPHTDGFDESVIDRLGPTLAPGIVGSRHTGFDETQRVDWAESVLRAMSMVSNFARLVLMTGHGSTTVNNPYASGLDCGACGGYTGEANARVAALVLNDRNVRAGLRERGIDIPEDTWFVGALHDTTTDDIRLFLDDPVPSTHELDLAQTRDALARASSRARRERAKLLRIPLDRRTDARVRARSRDWSQVRPEWGLAGNAAFVAAPRSRTRDIDLSGRAFLHDYSWRLDREFATLELIMTAPMVVASWINLQYYGSTVNNRVFGSGNKVLHNVSGVIGVLEGYAGDLKVGLPLQSVHDGERFVHEPLRLNVIIEAPLEAMNAIIAKHEMVRQLVDNRWLHLFAMGEDGRVSQRYAGNGTWVASNPPA